MAGRRKIERGVIDVPIVNPPDTPPALPPPPTPVKDGEVEVMPGSAIAEPQTVVPDSPEAVINNVLCREIVDPSAEDEPSDPNLTVLDEVAKGISTGADMSHVKNDVVRIAAHQAAKVDVVKALMRGLDLSRVNTFAQVRAKAEAELARAAMRGDLTSTEYLSFLRWSTLEIKNIMSELNSEEDVKSHDPASVIDRMDKGLADREAEEAKRYKGTTPQGREIIRKQVYDMQRRLKAAGKLKPGKAPAPESPDTESPAPKKAKRSKK